MICTKTFQKGDFDEIFFENIYNLEYKMLMLINDNDKNNFILKRLFSCFKNYIYQ